MVNTLRSFERSELERNLNYRKLLSCLPSRSVKTLFLSYENGTIDDKEFSVLLENFVPPAKTPDFSYEGHNADFRPDII